ncbi:MAG: hypothetical protein UT37_C0010G0020 [Parcubacteria group bacterium GW2011_GWA2_39_18]|nr:MAG: hypothetical protein UT37_C0010G0020 [Parcubacteria group bacterium GW2011_GWA2_39_18]
MQIYIDKIKIFSNKILRPLKSYLFKLNATDISKIFFWFFIAVSIISSLLIYFIFIKALPAESLNVQNGMLVNLPAKEVDQINANLNNKKNFKSAEIKSDPFAF